MKQTRLLSEFSCQYEYTRLCPIVRVNIYASFAGSKYRLKSGIFGQTAKLGQRHCLFHISNKLTKQTVKILMRRLIRSRLSWIYTVCNCVSEFTWCPNLRDFTLFVIIKVSSSYHRGTVTKCFALSVFGYNPLLTIGLFCIACYMFIVFNDGSYIMREKNNIILLFRDYQI